MANQLSIARPYAKALFEHAVAGQQLAAWSMWLQALGQLMEHPALHVLLRNPAVSRDQQAEVVIAIAHDLACEPMVPALDNLIRLLAANKRLYALPAIATQFDALRAEQEKTLTVCVCSFSPLTTLQEQRLVDSLSQRLQRQVTLQQTVDPSLLGGAVIRANDLVIDGSVRGQLIKLGADLAA